MIVMGISPFAVGIMAVISASLIILIPDALLDLDAVVAIDLEYPLGAEVAA